MTATPVRGDNPWRMDIDTLAMGPQRPSAGPTKPTGAKKIYDKPIGPTVSGRGRPEALCRADRPNGGRGRGPQDL